MRKNTIQLNVGRPCTVSVTNVEPRDGGTFDVRVMIDSGVHVATGVVSVERSGEPLAGANEWSDWIGEGICAALASLRVDDDTHVDQDDASLVIGEICALARRAIRDSLSG